MIVIRKSFLELKTLANEKGLQLFQGNESAGRYHVMAFDGEILYEAFVARNGSDDVASFEAVDLPLLANRKTSEPVWDTINITFPASNRELHTYLNNGVTVQTVLTVYETASRRQIVRVEKVLA